MNVSSRSKAPESEGAFDSLTFEVRSCTDKSSLVLGLVNEHDTWYFVIRKRFPEWGVDVPLDAVRVDTAVERIRNNGASFPHSFKFEMLRVAFENFILSSPFTPYVRKSVNQWDAAQLFNKLRAVAPALIIMQPRQNSNEQRSVDPRVPQVS
jgi:hypothetical protein